MTTLAPTRRPQIPHDTHEVEALIEEAHRRARRRRATVGSVVLLAFGAALGVFFAFGGGGGSAARPRGGGDPSPSAAREFREIARAAKTHTIVEAALVAPGRGWAMNGLALWSTANGGRAWRAITPPPVLRIGDPVARIDEIRFVDHRHAWITASDIWGRRVLPNGSMRHFEIERTTDGGRTWRSSIPPGCAGCGGGHLSFLDARRGYVLTGVTPSRLYSTDDGGVTWQLIAPAPFRGAIVFLDRRNAFGASDSGVLYRTRDGGRRWQRVRLVAPMQYAGDPSAVELPRFFGRDLAVMPVRFRNSSTHAQRLVVYVTRDGGDTWTPRTAPRNVDLRALSWGFPGGVPFSASRPDDWIVFTGKTLYKTANAGRSWSAIHPRYAPVLPAIVDVDFSSPTHGWAIFSTRQGSTLVQTTNGGRDWTPVPPPKF
jgi:photosystem II stability/assembly factor-like uncharacterized protein